jgi:branched-chain amino acid transport system substrate-binding protein
MAGIPVKVIFEDDQAKPEVGKQKAEKLLGKDKVDFLSGIIWSNVLLAVRKTAIDSGKFLVISNAGYSGIAGKLCNKNIFSTSWTNDQIPMALGEELNNKGVKSLYVIAPNYAAGKDMITGLKMTFKGKIIGQDMTKWPAQTDFSAELAKARAAKPDGIFIFYPGAHTVAFIRQYQQAGMQNIPLYSVFSVDSLSLPKLQQAKASAVLSSFNTLFWAPDLDTPGSHKFVAAYKKKYGKYPSHYGAQSYDSILLIASAVEAVKGDLGKMDAMRRAMEKADFESVRGKFAFNNNHIPIQNIYLRKVVADKDGVWMASIARTVFKDHQDPYHAQCPMKKTWYV